MNKSNLPAVGLSWAAGGHEFTGATLTFCGYMGAPDHRKAKSFPDALQSASIHGREDLSLAGLPRLLSRGEVTDLRTSSCSLRFLLFCREKFLLTAGGEGSVAFGQSTARG